MSEAQSIFEFIKGNLVEAKDLLPQDSEYYPLLFCAYSMFEKLTLGAAYRDLLEELGFLLLEVEPNTLYQQCLSMLGKEDLSFHRQRIVRSVLLVFKAILNALQEESSDLLCLFRLFLACHDCYLICKRGYARQRAMQAIQDDDLFSVCALIVGVFNFAISMMPQRLKRILGTVGFDDDREFSLSVLKYAATDTSGIFSPLCKVFLLGIYLYVAPVFKLHVQSIEHPVLVGLVKGECQRYAGSKYSIFILSRLQLQCKNTRNAALTLSGLSASGPSLLHWESLALLLAMEDFPNALKVSCLLKRQLSGRLATVPSFTAGLCYLKLGAEVEAEREFHAAVRGMRRYAGKTIPMEKYAVRKLLEHQDRGELQLEHLEFSLVVWNVADFLNRRQLLAILETLAGLDSLLPFLLKAIILSRLKKFHRAEEHFKRALLFFPCDKDTHLLPLTMTEYGALLLQLGRRKEAEGFLRRSLSLSGHPLITSIQIRTTTYLEGCTQTQTP